MIHLEKCQDGVRLYIWPSSKRMKDINWSQNVPPSPGKHQIILLSLAFCCIAQIWRAAYFTSFDLKWSDVGHKKGSREVQMWTDVREREKRGNQSSWHLYFPPLHIFTHRLAYMSQILFWRGDNIYIPHIWCSFTWILDFKFHINEHSLHRPCDHLWLDHSTRILIQNE